MWISSWSFNFSCLCINLAFLWLYMPFCSFHIPVSLEALWKLPIPTLQLPQAIKVQHLVWNVSKHFCPVTWEMQFIALFLKTLCDVFFLIWRARWPDSECRGGIRTTSRSIAQTLCLLAEMLPTVWCTFRPSVSHWIPAELGLPELAHTKCDGLQWSSEAGDGAKARSVACKWGGLDLWKSNCL